MGYAWTADDAVITDDIAEDTPPGLKQTLLLDHAFGAFLQP